MNLQRRRLLGLATVGLALPAALAHATPPSPRAPASAGARPTWRQLTPTQREALAPLESRWDGYDAARKQKWLEVAAKYPKLTPDGKRRLHDRMAEFAQLTPQQRQTLRENFRKAYELPAEHRRAVVRHFNDLPPEQREALTERARQKAEPPRRAARDLSSNRAAPSGGERTDPRPVSR